MSEVQLGITKLVRAKSYKLQNTKMTAAKKCVAAGALEP